MDEPTTQKQIGCKSLSIKCKFYFMLFFIPHWHKAALQKSLTIPNEQARGNIGKE